MSDTPNTKKFCGASAPIVNADGVTPACLLAVGHEGPHHTDRLGTMCTWDDFAFAADTTYGAFDQRLRRHRQRFDCLYRAALVEGLGKLIAGNARIVDLSRDRHGVVSVTHATRGTFRAGSLPEALSQLLLACGVDLTSMTGHDQGDGPTCSE